MDIRNFWIDVLRQDADAIRSYFHPDAVIRWHCTDEQFTVEEFIRANCEYPGDWDGEIERIEHSGDLIVTVLRVFPKDRSASFHVSSFIRVAEERIASADEYWADDGPAPQWRQALHIGTSIER